MPYRKNETHLNRRSTASLPKLTNAAMPTIRHRLPTSAGQPNMAAPIAPEAAPNTASSTINKAR
ncbi:hypothetical protein D3C71_2212790 [compost metagenome]